MSKVMYGKLLNSSVNKCMEKRGVDVRRRYNDLWKDQTTRRLSYACFEMDGDGKRKFAHISDKRKKHLVKKVKNMLKKHHPDVEVVNVYWSENRYMVCSKLNIVIKTQ